jgi:glycosyltransferase involved in cell wall biosynthesis
MARELGPGGSERQLTEIAKRLDRKRFSPVVGYFRGGMRLDELMEAGVPTIHVDIPSFKNPDVLSKTLQFRRFLQDQHVGIVHTFDYPLTCFAVPAARLFGVPVVLSSQRGHRDLIPPSYRQFIRLTDLLVDGIVVNCRAVQEDLISEEDVARRKIRLCYNGIDCDRFDFAMTSVMRNKFAPGSLTVGCVSVLRPEKNLHLLLSAVASLAPSLPELQVILVGSGPEESRLRERARQLNIGDRCFFQPSEKDVAPWLKSIDIFVLPSSTEALSNSLMEAMASGCAVVASRVGGNPELVRDGETGVLFTSGDERDLADKIRLLARNGTLRLYLGDNAKKLIRQYFHLDQSADRMAAIYEEFVSAKPDQACKPAPGGTFLPNS